GQAAQLVEEYRNERLESPSSELARVIADAALLAGDFKEAERWEQTLRGVEGASGEWKTLRLRRLLASDRATSKQRFAELRELLRGIETDRPDWPGTWLLKAQVAERRGELAGAADAYQRAIALGSRRVSVYRRLIEVLYRARRYADAERYLARLPASPRAASLAFAIQAKQGKMESASESVRQSAADHPDDPLAQIMFGHVLLRDGREEEAKAAFQLAYEKAPGNPRGLLGLFSFYRRTDRLAEARKLLDSAKDLNGVSTAQRLGLLAQCHESLNDPARAAELHDQARRADPSDSVVRRDAVAFLLRTDPRRGEEAVRDVLRQTPDSDFARRRLAMLLATRGGRENWDAALKVLERSGQTMTAGDERLKAALLARRGGQTHWNQAREILQRLADGPDGIAADRMVLATIHEQEGRTREAREQLLTLAGKPGASASHLAAYVALLLRQDRAEQAGPFLDQLASLEPSAFRSTRLRSQWLVASNRSAEVP
ncbi:MAG: tetratricopeptide repeat protein, partial [Planctomycetales bacterium]